MKRIPLLIFSLLTIVLLNFALPAARAADAPTNSTSEISALRSEVETLKAENIALKKENQSLRHALATKTQQVTDSATAVPKAPSVVAPTQQQTGYWITISSG